ncbi:isatin hydrolase-like isoform X1 [Haliotis rufescens]|uniref:isatin hydrolase-like isoform X1 n=1 Tax=Haliotis rufescens TaxID=6454 RepID=UPI00201E97C9|nr:isatin hydrolase-like isoform X1 [Haliotis rufescens]
MYIRVMLLTLALCCLWFPVCAVVDSDMKFVDLTHPVGDRENPPGSPPFNLTRILTMNIRPGIVAEANAFSTPEHPGTHIDAPLHFCPSGLPVGDIPIQQLSGPGFVLDLTAEAEANPDFQVTTQTLTNFEKVHGRIQDGAVVLFNFGWDKFWPDMNRVYNSESMLIGTYHYPGLSPYASRWLTSNRKVHAVGSDTPSIDYGLTTLFETHVNLLCDNGVIILENVANLGNMTATGSRVYIGAIRLERGSGTPARIFATLDSGSEASLAPGPAAAVVTLVVFGVLQISA